MRTGFVNVFVTQIKGFPDVFFSNAGLLVYLMVNPPQVAPSGGGRQWTPCLAAVFVQ
jgi:hypothetical protein